MIQLFSILFSLAGLAVMILIFWKKIPEMVSSSREKEKKESKIKEAIVSLPIFKKSFWNNLFLKILSKIRVVVLKIERKITYYLNSLRQKSQKK